MTFQPDCRISPVTVYWASPMSLAGESGRCWPHLALGFLEIVSPASIGRISPVRSGRRPVIMVERVGSE